MLVGVAKALEGHPLALTWAGCQLARREEPAGRFLAEMQKEHPPSLHQADTEHHTLKWLYDRSVRMVGDDARRVLCAAGLLASAPFDLFAAIVALVQDPKHPGTDLEERASEALRQLVRHALLRVAGSEERWEFSHALAARFATAEAKASRLPLAPLCAWALDALRQGAEQVGKTGEFARLRNALLHAIALLAHDDSGDVGWPLAKWLLYEGQDRFFALGRLGSARDSLTAVEAWMQRMPPARSDEPSWRREQAGLLSRKGNVQLAQGDLAAALDSYQQGLKIAEKLAAGDPSNAQWQRDLSVSLEKLGNVQLAQGDLAAARDSYEKDLKIAEKLAAGDPTNTEWQRDLGATHCFVGIAQQAQGDLAGAVVSYAAYRDIMEKLAAGDPSNAPWQRDLSVSLERLGDVQWVQGDLAAARDAYQNSRRIREKLAAGDPSNAQWQRDLVVSHAKLGNVAARAGDKPGAQREFSAGLAIMERLCRLDPTNATWRNDAEVLREQLQR